MIACATPDEENESEKFFDVWNHQFLMRQQELDDQAEKEQE